MEAETLSFIKRVFPAIAQRPTEARAGALEKRLCKRSVAAHSRKRHKNNLRFLICA